MAEQHYPTPWWTPRPPYRNPEQGGFWAIDIECKTDELIAYIGTIQGGHCTPEAKSAVEANAEFLVRAVNCHNELVEALRAVVFQAIQGKVLERDACIAQARAAIAKATGGGHQPSREPTAADHLRDVLRHHLAAWDASTAAEKLLGRDIDSAADAAESFLAGIDDASQIDDVSDDEVLAIFTGGDDDA